MYHLIQYVVMGVGSGGILYIVGHLDTETDRNEHKIPSLVHAKVSINISATNRLLLAHLPPRVITLLYN